MKGRKVFRRITAFALSLSLLVSVSVHMSVVDSYAELTEASEQDFYNKDNWDLDTAVKLDCKEADEKIELKLPDYTSNFNGYAVYKKDDAQNWSNYRFDVTVRSYKYKPNGSNEYKYTNVGLSVYGGSTAYAMDHNSYGVRVEVPSKDTYNMFLYSMKTVDGNRVAQPLPSKVVKAENTGFGNEYVEYKLGIQVYEGIIDCFLNGEKILTYDARNSEYAHTEGTVGIFMYCSSRDTKVERKIEISDLSVTEVSGRYEEEDPRDSDYEQIEQIPREYKNDGETVVIYKDDFAQNTSLWNWEGNDQGMGDWSIRKGLMVNRLDSPSDNSIILFDRNKYIFGSVAADVMLTSSLENNMYVGPVAAYDDRSYYHLRISDMKDGIDKIQLYRMDSGTAKLLQAEELDFSIEREKWYHLELAMSDGVLKGILDGTTYIEHDTSDDGTIFTAGSAGIRSSQGSAIVDNFVLRVPRGEIMLNHIEEGAWKTVPVATDSVAVRDGAITFENGGFVYYSEEEAEFESVAASVTFDGGGESGASAGPVMAYRDSGLPFYQLKLADVATASNALQIVKHESSGAEKVLAQTRFEMDGSGPYWMELYQYGGTLYGYVDNVLYLAGKTGEGALNGYAGFMAEDGSVRVDEFRIYNVAKELEPDIKYNETVVDNPVIFEDNFEEYEISGNPDGWLEKNTENKWKVISADGQGKAYGVTDVSPEEESATWLHVFETNVDLTSKLYVASAGTSSSAQAGVIVRLSGTQAHVIVGYDFKTKRWFVRDRKGLDFDEKIIWADSESEFAKDQWHTVNVRTVGPRLVVTADDVPVLETDKIEQVTTGRVGVYTRAAVCYVDDVRLQLLSGQGRVEKAVMQNYIITPDSYSEGGFLFEYDDQITLFNGLGGKLYISRDQGDTFVPATPEENEKYAFFIQNARSQYVRLHDGDVLKVDNYTGGKAYLFDWETKTSQQVGQMWAVDKIENKWEFYGGMGAMIKEVNLGDIDGDGADNYRVFYCADVRATGNPEGTGSVTEHWEEVYYTDDSGYTWNRSELPDTRWISGLANICESRVMSFDGTLVMFCTWNDSVTARYFVSHDYGVTWEGEYALPQLRCTKSSFDYMYDPDSGYTYMTFIYTDSVDYNSLLRNRLVLLRSRNGEDWEFVMDVWRWEDVPGDGKENIYQTVDPTITITKDYVFVTAGWSEKIDKSQGHNAQRQTIVKIRKSDITSYEEWPDDYTLDKDVVHIQVTPPDKKVYKIGEELDLSGGTVTAYYYDGTSKTVPLTEKGVSISEPDASVNYTSRFGAPDMNVPGEKYLRVTYASFAAPLRIKVVDGDEETDEETDEEAGEEADTRIEDTELTFAFTAEEKANELAEEYGVTDTELQRKIKEQIVKVMNGMQKDCSLDFSASDVSAALRKTLESRVDEDEDLFILPVVDFKSMDSVLEGETVIVRSLEADLSLIVRTDEREMGALTELIKNRYFGMSVSVPDAEARGGNDYVEWSHYDSEKGVWGTDVIEDPVTRINGSVATVRSKSFSPFRLKFVSDDNEKKTPVYVATGSSIAVKESGRWIKDTNGWWYRYPNGTRPVNGWAQLEWDGRTDWYYFDEKGYMKTGWITDGGLKYYLHPLSDGRQGYMYTGWNMIDGIWYYFSGISDGTKGHLLTDTVTPDGYSVDGAGQWIQ